MRFAIGATTFPKDALPGDAAEEKGPIARREIFSPDTGAFMEIEISEDRQQAAIKTLSFCGDPALTAEDITEGLAQLFGIEHGVLESAVRELAGRAQAAPDKVHRGGRGPGALRCGLRPGPCPAGLLLAQDRRDQSPAAQRGIVDRTRRRADLAEPGGRC